MKRMLHNQNNDRCLQQIWNRVALARSYDGGWGSQFTAPLTPLFPLEVIFVIDFNKNCIFVIDFNRQSNYKIERI